MILRLVVLQFRSGWRLTVSTAATLALTVALGTFAMVLAATQIALQATTPGSGPGGDGHVAQFSTVLGDPGAGVEDANLENLMSLDAVEALVASAAREIPLTATSYTVGHLPGTDTWVGILIPLHDPSLDQLLWKGSLPQSGEIALSATVAASLNLTIGDTITLATVDDRLSTPTARLTVSGILRDGEISPYSTWVPEGIASWEDVEYLAVTLASSAWVDPETDAVSLIIQTSVTWNGDNSALSRFEYWDNYTYDGRFRWSDALGNLGGPGGWALLLAGLTVACLIAAALGMGRSRAESRARWSGTARVLGATRGTIAAASILETLIISLVGAGLGLGAGVLAAHLQLVYLQWSHPDGLLPSAISVPSVVVGAGVALGATLAVILAAVPAFWASRVAPVAALKPVTPIREATLSRVVNPWWPTGIMLAGFAVSATLTVLNRDGSLGWGADMGVMLGQLAWFIAGAAVVVQVARGIVAGVGRWLARSRVPWVLAAGDGLLSHRRSFTFAALATSVLAALLAIPSTMSTFTALLWTEDYRGWGEVPHISFSEWWQWNVAEAGVLRFASVAFAVIAVIAVVVRASSRGSTSQEDATRSALGLSHRGARAAVALRDSAVMAGGTVVGALAGWALSLVWRIGGAATSPYELVYSFRWNATSAVYGLAATGAIIGIGLIASVGTGLLVSRLAAASPPVSAIGRSEG